MVLRETQSGVLKIGGRVWKDQPLSEKETTTGVGKGWAVCGRPPPSRDCHLSLWRKGCVLVHGAENTLECWGIREKLTRIPALAFLAMWCWASHPTSLSIPALFHQRGTGRVLLSESRYEDTNTVSVPVPRSPLLGLSCLACAGHEQASSWGQKALFGSAWLPLTSSGPYLSLPLRLETCPFGFPARTSPSPAATVPFELGTKVGG